MIYNNQIATIYPTDVGYLVSKVIAESTEYKKLSLKIAKTLDAIFLDSIIQHPRYGLLLAIKNLGILFEPDLKLDIYHLLEKYSRTNALFLKWSGDIDGSTLYFLSKLKGEKINIQNLSHIII